jgi:SAM-dependent methyltransferase
LTDRSPELRRQLAGSFGGVADDYERARPGYPEEAVREITKDSRGTVLDLAAGTGKLTRQLHSFGFSVVAVELSVEMLRRLQALEEAIATIAGRAEALPCRDASFDLATVAQAWHWFDPARASAELARVLRPGGYACVLWNFRDESVDWVAELSTIIGSEGTSDAESDSDPFSDSPAFSPSARHEYRFQQPLDRDLLMSLVRSRSYVATLPRDEQRAVLNRVIDLCEHHPQLAGRAEFALPYRTLLFRAQRIR